MDLAPLSSVPLAWFRRLPLRFRMSIPFLFLAFFGTFSLVWLAISSQNDLIRKHEEERLFGYYRAFEHGLELQGRWALSLATSIASDPDVTEKLAQRDRIWLLQHFYPVYLQMKEEYGISQFLFEVPPDRAFLRLHRLYEFGDSLGLYRQGSGEAMAQGKGVYGLEGGLTGYYLEAERISFSLRKASAGIASFLTTRVPAILSPSRCCPGLRNSATVSITSPSGNR